MAQECREWLERLDYWLIDSEIIYFDSACVCKIVKIGGIYSNGCLAKTSSRPELNEVSTLLTQKPTHEVHSVKNHDNDWMDYTLSTGEVVFTGTEEQCHDEAEKLRAVERTTRPANSLGYRYVVHPVGTT